MSLDNQIHRRINLFQQSFVRLHAATRRAVRTLRNINGHILETAEAHRLGMAQHARVVNRRAQAAAGGEGHLVTVEDKVRRSVLRCQIAGFLENLVLIGIRECFARYVEIALGEFKDATAAIAFTPNLQQRRREPPRFLGIVAILHDVFAASLKILLAVGIVVHPFLLVIQFGQNKTSRPVSVLNVQVHQVIAAGIRIVAQQFLQRNDRSTLAAKHVRAAWSNRRNRLQVLRNTRVNIEVQEQGLATA